MIPLNLETSETPLAPATLSTPVIETLTLRAMGCEVQVHLDISTLQAHQSSAQVSQRLGELKAAIERQLAQWEQIFSRFDNNSELMRLNAQAQRNPEQWIEISEPLFEVLQLAVRFVSQTQGLVTPTLLNTLCDMGYQTSFETLAKVPDDRQLFTENKADKDSQTDKKDKKDKTAEAGVKLRRCSEGHPQVKLPSGAALDLNGYVKGWSADQLARWISQESSWSLSCLVDLGGDMAVGVNENRGCCPMVWGVAIAKPSAISIDSTANLTGTQQAINQQAINSEPPQQISDYSYNHEVNDWQQDLGVIHLSSGGVATSGQDYRRWWYQGQWHHHLINPLTKCAAQSDVITATIIADDTLTAEVWAKYCVLLGCEQALAWLNDQHIKGAFVDSQGQLRCSDAIRPYLLLAD